LIHTDQKNSFILTAWHCIAESVSLDTPILVQTIDNQTFDAQLSQDLSIQELDLAILRIEHLIDHHAVPLAFIKKDLIGNEVIAVGYPAGYIEDRGLGVYEGIINQLLDTGTDEFETTAIEGCGQSGGMIYHYGSGGERFQWLLALAQIQRQLQFYDPLKLDEIDHQSVDDQLGAILNRLCTIFQPYRGLQLALASEKELDDNHQRQVVIHCYWQDNLFRCVSNKQQYKQMKRKWEEISHISSLRTPP
jgi:hypothetical protein